MRRIPFLFLFFWTACAFGQEPVDLAKPIIATAKPRYDFFASASLPYGMVSLYPDTHHGELWDAGYRYNDGYVLDFSHIHNTQTAGIPVMPVVGPCKALLGLEASKCRLSHVGEIAKPGYHKIFLEDYGITAELTASARAGFHRYTFPAAKEAHIIMDLTAALGPVKMLWGYARKRNNTEIEGYSVMAPTFRRKKKCTVYFVARFSKPFDKLSFWGAAAGDSSSQELVAGDLTSDRKAGVYASYYDLKKGEQILLRVGVSFVSMENARLNLDSEMPAANFEEAVARATKAWNDYLGRIEVSGGTRKQQVKFYTDLMHTAIGRRLTEDVNGQYVDNTGATPVVRRIPLAADGKPAYHFMDADGLWGTQWNLNILWPMVYPDYGNDLANTFLSYYRYAGVLTRDSWGGDMCHVMVGDQTTPLLAALIQSRRANFNIEEAFAGAYKNAFPGGERDRAGYESGPHPKGGGIDWYIKYGYVPFEIKDRGDGYHRGGAAMTLEYAFQDWCIANMAKTLNKKESYEPFMKRAGNWKNVYDPASGFMRPKDTMGRWLTPFEPVGTSGATAYATPGFIEANASIYSYYVPQDVQGLINARGGEAAFIRRLDTSFARAVATDFAAEHGNHWSAVVDYDNQPGCEMAHLFSHAGAPWKTQYWVRQVESATFGDTTVSGGYKGDEDQGQMGALSVLMAVGLFDVQGLADVDPSLEITSPIFDKVVFHLPDDKEFTIKTSYRSGRDNTYIQSVRLNGKAWDSFEFPFHEFAEGGLMEIELGDKPNKKWGIRRRQNSTPEADSRQELSLSNLVQDGHTMIALAFGQSNAANRGQALYVPKQASVFNYYKGDLYAARDPLLGNTGAGGSVWTRLGDMLIDSGLFTKVIIVPIAVSGSAISCWTSGDCCSKLKETLASLDSQHVKLTHILWHQGETDNLLNTSKEVYKRCLDSIVKTIRQYHQDAAMYISIASYHPGAVGKPMCVDSIIRDAQKEFINEHERVLLGPDTDSLIDAIDRYDGVHFSDFGMKAFARRWYQAIKQGREKTNSQ